MRVVLPISGDMIDTNDVKAVLYFPEDKREHLTSPPRVSVLLKSGECASITATSNAQALEARKIVIDMVQMADKAKTETKAA